MARQRGSTRKQRYGMKCGGKTKMPKRAKGYAEGGMVMRGAGAATRGKKFTRNG